MLYDTLLLFAVLMLAAIPLAFISEPIREWPPVEWTIRTYLLGVSFAYFAGFWHHGGQTLGMRAWRLRVLDRDGAKPTFAQLTKRFAGSILSWIPCGGGFVWIALNRRREALHDRLSGTIIVHEPLRRAR